MKSSSVGPVLLTQCLISLAWPQLQIISLQCKYLDLCHACRSLEFLRKDFVYAGHALAQHTAADTAAVTVHFISSEKVWTVSAGCTNIVHMWSILWKHTSACTHAQIVPIVWSSLNHQRVAALLNRHLVTSLLTLGRLYNRWNSFAFLKKKINCRFSYKSVWHGSNSCKTWFG